MLNFESLLRALRGTHGDTRGDLSPVAACVQCCKLEQLFFLCDIKDVVGKLLEDKCIDRAAELTVLAKIYSRMASNNRGSVRKSQALHPTANAR